MAERETRVVHYAVDYACDECRKGVMEPINFGPGVMIKSPRFLHKCSACGCEQWLDQKYPEVRYRRIEAE